MSVHTPGKSKSSRLSLAILKEIEELGAPRLAVSATDAEVMKPETSDGPFTRKGWVFELKYDGFRVLAEKAEDTARLAYRSGRDATRIFPEITLAITGLPYRSILLDGEVVILDESGKPDFQLLQRRAQRSEVDSPPVLFVFDLLSFEGYDLRPLPLTARKSILRRVLLSTDLLRTVEEVPERGEDLFAAVSSLGLEGVVAKREDSPYKGGYSPHWLKIRVDRTCDFIIVGYEPGPGGVRRLHLAVCEGREGTDLAYAGTVGSGLDAQEMAEIRARLDPARRPPPPVTRAPKDRNAVWVEPELVCEVRYKEWTRGGHLRQPVFLRLREDKRTDECRRPPDAPGEEKAPPEEPVETVSRSRFTNLDKVFWPDEGYTKGDLINYYRSVSRWMLPYLKDRPLVLDRYPNGITGKSFFQKNAGESAGPLKTVTVAGDSRAIEYFLCNDEESLLYLANLGAIPFHVWSSRIKELDRPDWCILDLDPKGAPFRDVARIALALGDLCDEIELPSFIKTSGGSGLHILIPLGGQCDHDQSRQIAELLARVLVDRLPAIATTLRSIPARKGRVYVDALQNGRGKLLAAPYSVRPHPGAPVSTPLSWSEVSSKLDVRRHNLRTVPKRLEKLSEDPLLPVLDLRPDLMTALGRLAELI
jgi:bifunctional non-homologous end joining protein LigD